MSNAPNTANALCKLWELCADTMTIDELKWFKGLDLFAEMEAGNIADTLDATAMLISNTNPSALPDKDTHAAMLWSFAYQVDTISKLIEIIT